MANSEEIYVYLGCTTNTLFFSHYISNVNVYDTKISEFLYTFLINESIIKNGKTNLVIYDLCQNKQLTDVIIVQHASNKQKIIFDKNDLREIAKTFNKDVPNILHVVKYDYDKAFYYSDVLKNTQNIPKFLLQFIDTIYTFKNFKNLSAN